MYSLLLETYIKDPKEKSRLFHAIDNIPAIQRKAEWAMKWIQRSVFVHAAQHPLLLLHRLCPPLYPLALSDQQTVACSSNCFAERLVAFAAVEGIFFSGR